MNENEKKNDVNKKNVKMKKKCKWGARKVVIQSLPTYFCIKGKWEMKTECVNEKKNTKWINKTENVWMNKASVNEKKFRLNV